MGGNTKKRKLLKFHSRIKFQGRILNFSHHHSIKYNLKSTLCVFEWKWKPRSFAYFRLYAWIPIRFLNLILILSSIPHRYIQFCKMVFDRMPHDVFLWLEMPCYGHEIFMAWCWDKDVWMIPHLSLSQHKHSKTYY